MASSVTFIPLVWDCRDVDHFCNVIASGKSTNGKFSVCARFVFTPYFFTTVPSDSDIDDLLREEIVGPAKMKRSEILDAQFVERRNLVGGAAVKVARFVLKSLAGMRSLQRILLSSGYELFEADVNPLLRFFHVREISPSAPLSLQGTLERQRRVSRCDIEMTRCECQPAVASQVSTICIASFDIEVFSSTGDFPVAENPADRMFMISVYFSDQQDAVCIADSTFAGIVEVAGNKLQICEDEAAMLQAFARIIHDRKVDVLTGYNVWGFDMPFMLTRAGLHRDKCPDFFALLSRFVDSPVNAIPLTIACGTPMEATPWRTGGVLQIDMLYYLRKFHPGLRSGYKLDDVCKTFLGSDSGKTGLSIADMNAAYSERNVDQLSKVVEYCVQDARLVLELIERLNVVQSMQELANVTSVPLDFVIKRGQQIKVFSLLLKQARLMGYLCPSTAPTKKASKDPGYAGAYVLDPQVGTYWNPVVCVDFASLYPSIIMAHNLCYTTIDSLPETRQVAPPAVLPTLLRTIYDSRIELKERLKNDKNLSENEKVVINARQQALKIVMNSVYGFCGCSDGFIPCIRIAAEITRVGRTMITEARDGALRFFEQGSIEVVYGDTDSLMIHSAKDSDPQRFLERVHEFVAAINHTLPNPVKLCVDKAYCPFLLFSKKRYIGLPHGSDEIEYKGVQVVRRETCDFVREIYTTIMQKILREKDTEGALLAFEDAARRLLRGEVDRSKLVLSKTIRDSVRSMRMDRDGICTSCGTAGCVQSSTNANGKRMLQCGSCGAVRVPTYQHPDGLQHVQVAMDSLASARPGDTVRYYHAAPAVGAKRKRTVAENVDAVPDFEYYYDHHLHNPIKEIFKVLQCDLYNQVVRRLEAEKQRGDRQQTTITQFAQSLLHQELRQASHK